MGVCNFFETIIGDPFGVSCCLNNGRFRKYDFLNQGWKIVFRGSHVCIVVLGLAYFILVLNYD